MPRVISIAEFLQKSFDCKECFIYYNLALRLYLELISRNSEHDVFRRYTVKFINARINVYLGLISPQIKAEIEREESLRTKRKILKKSEKRMSERDLLKQKESPPRKKEMLYLKLPAAMPYSVSAANSPVSDSSSI